MLYVGTHKEEILARVKEAKRVALMFDFDGVLAPLVPDYRDATVSPHTKMLLRALARVFSVAVISGRELGDVEKRVGISNIFYGGNHGLEWKIGKRTFHAPLPAAPRKALQKVRKEISKLTKEFPGLFLEDKKLTISVHYRTVDPRLQAIVVKELETIVKPSIKSGALRIVGGHKVLNIRPATKLHKGTVALRMLKSVRGALPIFIGDDVTDEDAFRSLSKGITIRVGNTKESAAHYYVDSQKNVDAFLEALLKIKANMSRR